MLEGLTMTMNEIEISEESRGGISLLSPDRAPSELLAMFALPATPGTLTVAAPVMFDEDEGEDEEFEDGDFDDEDEDLGDEEEGFEDDDEDFLDDDDEFDDDAAGTDDDEEEDDDDDDDL